MSGQVPKPGLKYWKLRARKLTLHLVNVAEINAQTKLMRLKLTVFRLIVASRTRHVTHSFRLFRLLLSSS